VLQSTRNVTHDMVVRLRLACVNSLCALLDWQQLRDTDDKAVGPGVSGSRGAEVGVQAAAAAVVPRCAALWLDLWRPVCAVRSA